MFKHSHLEKKLREHGRAGQAEILSIKTEGNSGTLNPIKAYTSTDDDLTTRWWVCKLELRIMPPGEPAFEKTVHTRLNTIKAKGDIVPVLYDPTITTTYSSTTRQTRRPRWIIGTHSVRRRSAERRGSNPAHEWPHSTLDCSSG
jgi:hypothetical protein